MIITFSYVYVVKFAYCPHRLQKQVHEHFQAFITKIFVERFNGNKNIGDWSSHCFSFNKFALHYIDSRYLTQVLIGLRCSRSCATSKIEIKRVLPFSKTEMCERNIFGWKIDVIVWKMQIGLKKSMIAVTIIIAK